MRDKQFAPRDKKVTKMTRQGLVEQNAATGEETRISQREQDWSLRGEDGPAQGFGPDRSGGGVRQRQADAPMRPGEAPAQAPDAPGGGHRPRAAPQGPQATGQTEQPPGYPADACDTAQETGQNTPSTDTGAPGRAGGYEPPPAPASGAHRPRIPRKSPRTDTAKHGYEQTGRLRFSEAERPPADTPKADRQKGTKYAGKFATEDGDGTQAAPGQPEAPAPSFRDKLQFTQDELPPDPDGKLGRLQGKADVAETKLAEARKKLRTRKTVKLERTFDEAKGKGKTHLHFEDEVVPRGPKKQPLPVRAGKRAGQSVTRAGANKLHQKVHEVENENVGVKAAHRGEMGMETLYRGGKRAGRSALQYVRDRPYRTVAKLERQATKANMRLAYQKALHENPKLKSNLLSRFMQKQKIRRQYAAAAREAKRAGTAAQKAGNFLARTARAVVGVVKRHPVALGIIGLLGLLVVFIMTSFSSCSNMASGGLGAVVASSYLAEDADIDNAELVYTQWETGLQTQVNNAERDRPGYDEYRYNVADIGHNPYELMAFLTAAYQNFTYSGVEAVLREIFDEQYSLTFTPEVEIRTRTVTKTDPETGEDYEEEEEYEWHVLNITLTARSFTDLVTPRMTGDQREIYDLLMESKGNRQYAYSPFDFNWLPYVSCYYGWRIHPITGAEDNHKAVDIAVAEGTEIIAAHDGTVTTATWHDSYGWYIALDDGEGLVTKYAHCSQLLVSAGQVVSMGDVIAKVGSTGDSTGPHLHFEVIQNGVYLNPLYFAQTNDDGSGSLPPGTPGGPEIPANPGAAMGDGSYAALIAEAESMLGLPYVFGAKGPNAYDCSGFVCAALTRSGVKSIQTNAQGLFNACTPVSLANARPGDLLFFHSTYSTANTVTHVAIYTGGNSMIHAGNPIQYTTFDTSYWQSHFYAVGRI